MNSVPSMEIGTAAKYILPSEKFSTSAERVNSVAKFRSSILSLSSPRVSFMPGMLTIRAISFVPSPTSLPFVRVMFWN